MNNRVRWGVYQLLLSSMAMGFRSQHEYLFERNDIQARQIRLVDGNGKTRLVLNADTAAGGQIQFNDAKETPQRTQKAELEQPAEEQ